MQIPVESASRSFGMRAPFYWNLQAPRTGGPARRGRSARRVRGRGKGAGAHAVRGDLRRQPRVPASRRDT